MGRSTMDQTVFLAQNIEDSLKAKKKAGAVFVNLIAAYDSVWHCGPTCKLIRLLLGKHMVQMIWILSGTEFSHSLLVTASKAG